MLQLFVLLACFCTIFRVKQFKCDTKKGERMLDCVRQSFPMVLGQLPHRIKLNKKAKNLRAEEVFSKRNRNFRSWCKYPNDICR